MLILLQVKESQPSTTQALVEMAGLGGEEDTMAMGMQRARMRVDAAKSDNLRMDLG